VDRVKEARPQSDHPNQQCPVTAPQSNARLLETMFDLPSLEGVEQVTISQQVVEGSARPLCMYAARAGGARAT